MGKPKIKLLFSRHNYGNNSPSYRLDQIEGAVTAKLCNSAEYRVGESVEEHVVKAFAESKRDFDVRVRS